jgi:hypothetical protein
MVFSCFTFRLVRPAGHGYLAFRTPCCNEEHIGNTPDGIADPITTIGSALPQDIEIDRASLQKALGRVRLAASG